MNLYSWRAASGAANITKVHTGLWSPATHHNSRLSLNINYILIIHWSSTLPFKVADQYSTRELMVIISSASRGTYNQLTKLPQNIFLLISTHHTRSIILRISENIFDVVCKRNQPQTGGVEFISVLWSHSGLAVSNLWEKTITFSQAHCLSIYSPALWLAVSRNREQPLIVLLLSHSDR